MYRLCFGTIMTILYQARSHKVTNKSICNALFSCFGKTVESYDSSTPGHLKSGKINVPPDVIDVARKTNADELDAAVQKNIIPLIKLSQQEAIVRSLKDIIRNDSSIMDNTVIGYCSGYEKQSILGGQVFCISSLLASVIYYACIEVKNSDCAEAIKSITGEYVKGFEDGEPIYFKGSDAKPKPKLTYTLQDPSFDKVFVKVKSWLINLPSGVTEIEIYKVSDVTNRQLRFNRMREYLIDHIGEYVFSRAKRDMKLVYADEKRADFLFPFTEKEYDSMVEKFGKFCVIVNGRELECHINYYCEENECDYIFDKVEYCEQNRLDRMQAFSKSAKERFLYKNKDLAYQREYRLVIAHELPIDHFVRIGKLDNTKILETEDMREFKFSIGYISHQIGEEMI